jgi:ribonuclease HI
MYTFPVLKALEGVLKYNLQKCGIVMTSTAFTMFDKIGGVYNLQVAHSVGLSSDHIIKLENCYNHLNNNRHTLFHFGVIIGGVDTNTRLLKTKKEADDIIKDTLKIIDDNYIA